MPDTLVSCVVRYPTIQRGYNTEPRGVFTLPKSFDTAVIPYSTIQQDSARPHKNKRSGKVRYELDIGNRHIRLLDTRHLRQCSKSFQHTREFVRYQTRTLLFLPADIQHIQCPAVHVLGCLQLASVIFLDNTETQEPQYLCT